MDLDSVSAINTQKRTWPIFSNYWMRLSRIWRILQIKEGVILQRPKAELDKTFRDLQNSSYPTKAEFNNCFIIHSKYSPVLEGVSLFRSLFFRSPKLHNLVPRFSRLRFNNLQRAALLTSFWRHRFNNFRRAVLLTSLIHYGEDSLQIWWTAAGYGELYVRF